MKKIHVFRCMLLTSSIYANLANADLVVIMSAHSQVDSLSSTQVARCFLGKQACLPTGDSAVAVDQPKGDLRDHFYLKFTAKPRAVLASFWAQRVFTGAGKPPPQLASAAEVIEFVANTPNAMGYVDRQDVTPQVKVVASVP